MLESTSVRQQLRTMRAHYIANVKAKRCPMDKKVLAEFDETLKGLDREAKMLSRQR